MKYILFISWNVPRYQVNLCDSNSSGFVRSRDNTPAPLLNMDKEHEEQMINNFRSEMEEKIKEKEREQQEEKQERERKEEAVEEEAEVATKVMEMVTEEVASEVESQEGQTEPALPKDESIKVTKKKDPE